MSAALIISHSSFISSSLRIIRGFFGAKLSLVDAYAPAAFTRAQNLAAAKHTPIASQENREQIRSDIRRRDFRNT